MTLTQNPTDRAIGVFDSGLGGLTAVRELKALLPNEDIIYFGDTGRVPYGTHSFRTILKYARDDMRFLDRFGVKAVLIACGTVSAIALDTLTQEFSTPIIGVVEPAAKDACAHTKNGRIAVVGTPAAVKHGAYEREIKQQLPQASVLPIACPLFVPLVENGRINADDPMTSLAANEYLSVLQDFQPDVLILGCTHYPLIRGAIEAAASKYCECPVWLVDAGSRGAFAMRDLLANSGMLRPTGTATHKAVQKFFVSDEIHDFKNIASLFLGEAIEDVTNVNPENEEFYEYEQ